MIFMARCVAEDLDSICNQGVFNISKPDRRSGRVCLLLGKKAKLISCLLAFIFFSLALTLKELIEKFTIL